MHTLEKMCMPQLQYKSYTILSAVIPKINRYKIAVLSYFFKDKTTCGCFCCIGDFPRIYRLYEISHQQHYLQKKPSFPNLLPPPLVLINSRKFHEVKRF